MTNWKNRTIWTGDNLSVLRGLNSDTVDLIYLDPPFNSNRNYAAPVGSRAAGAAFKDAWTLDDVDELDHDLLRGSHPVLHDVILAARGAAGDSMMSYLLMMAVRLMELKRVLKPTGSIYLHCDPTASHYLKMIMDAVFGRQGFRNEIVWGYNKPRPASKQFVRNHDVVLFYSNGDEWSFNPQRVPTLDGKFELRKPVKRANGTYWKPKAPGKLAGSWWYDIPSFATRMTAKERTGFQTQKPVKLLERIIRASSNEGDVVLDPFCGCATTMIAAEKLGRQWIGIDLSPKSVELVQYRLHDQLGLASSLAVVRDDQPYRTDLGTLPGYHTHKRALYGEQGGHCNGCGTHFQIVNLSTDHIVPRSKGGTDHPSNLQLLCQHCNSRKGAGSMSELMVKLLKERGMG